MPTRVDMLFINCIVLQAIETAVVPIFCVTYSENVDDKQRLLKVCICWVYYIRAHVVYVCNKIKLHVVVQCHGPILTWGRRCCSFFLDYCMEQRNFYFLFLRKLVIKYGCLALLSTVQCPNLCPVCPSTRRSTVTSSPRSVAVSLMKYIIGRYLWCHSWSDIYCIHFVDGDVAITCYCVCVAGCWVVGAEWLCF